MSQVKQWMNMVKKIVDNCDNIKIMEFINSFPPIFILYYQMKNPDFSQYTSQLSQEYFTIPLHKKLSILNLIEDANLISYIINKYNLNISNVFTLNNDINHEGKKIIDFMYMHYININDYNNLKIMCSRNFNISGTTNNNINGLIYHYINTMVKNAIISENKPQLLELYLMDPDYNIPKTFEERYGYLGPAYRIMNSMNRFDNPDFNYYDDNYGYDFFDFVSSYCASIMMQGDHIEIIQVLHKYYLQYSDYIDFDFELLFNAALVWGREKCMQFALDNHKAEYYYREEDGEHLINNIFEITDSITYAIKGCNMTCIQTVFNIFMDKLNIKNRKNYFNFAASYGTPEIIQYMITLKPFLVDEIEDFYNNILQFSLANANIENVKYALEHGADYDNSMMAFFEEFNQGRPDEDDDDDDDDDRKDYLKYYSSIYTIQNATLRDATLEFMKSMNKN
jgi:hypothetical protein